MKKAISILLILLVSFASIGLTVNKHYCGGMLMITSVYAQQELCGEMTMPDDCCEDESIVFAVEDDFQINTTQISIAPELVGSIDEPLVVVSTINRYKTEASFFVEGSPPYPEPSIYIWDQSFLL